MENTFVRNAEALEKAGRSLNELLTHFESQDAQDILFNMFEASISGNNPEPEDIQSRCFIYDCLRRMFAAIQDVQRPDLHHFTIATEKWSFKRSIPSES